MAAILVKKQKGLKDLASYKWTSWGRQESERLRIWKLIIIIIIIIIIINIISISIKVVTLSRATYNRTLSAAWVTCTK